MDDAVCRSETRGQPDPDAGKEHMDVTLDLVMIFMENLFKNIFLNINAQNNDQTNQTCM